MKKRIRLKGRLKLYMQSSLILGILLLLLDVGLYFIDVGAGAMVSCFLVLYFAVIFMLMFYNRPVIMNEMISFATWYGQVQRTLLKELDIPYCLLDEGGSTVWMNDAFEQLCGRDKTYHISISSVFPHITREFLPINEPENTLHVEKDGREFMARLRRISMDGMLQESEIFEGNREEGVLIALYLYDETALNIALRENDNQSMSIGMIYIDNYDEALDSVEEVRRSLLVALVDRKINQYISALDGISKKLEKDKYLIILRKESVLMLEEERFDILEDVKTVNIGNEMAVTISIGVGLGGLTFAQNYEFARTAIEVALGRGGDQAVVKMPERTSYYGGKSQKVEKNTRVKARVKAQALSEIIETKDRVIAMGHRIGDPDAFGATIGIYRVAKTLGKRAYIVINEVTSSVRPLMQMFLDNPEYEEDMFIDNARAEELAGGDTVLVVCDTNRAVITECPELLRICKSIVVLDHHRGASDSIENATLSYVEPNASSTCEMTTEILQYVKGGIRPTSAEADCLYSGIVIDTNNFTTKTGVRTFEAAAYLRRNGADVTKVRKLFREDVAEYKAKADAVSQAEVYRNHYAISICSSEGLMSPTIIGAQAANELLNIKSIKASFIMTPYQGKIFISARSIDEVNVQIIMEKLGGGGHMNIAGVQLDDVPVEEAIAVLKRTLDEMIEKGELN